MALHGSSRCGCKGCDSLQQPTQARNTELDSACRMPLVSISYFKMSQPFPCLLGVVPLHGRLMQAFKAARVCWHTRKLVCCCMHVAGAGGAPSFWSYHLRSCRVRTRRRLQWARLPGRCMTARAAMHNALLNTDTARICATHPAAGSLLTYAASCSPVVAPSTRGELMARHAKQANATTDVASTSPCAARRMSAARC